MYKAQHILCSVALPLVIASCGGDASRALGPGEESSQPVPPNPALATASQFHELTRFANATFFGTDPSGCVVSVVEVFASEGPGNLPGAPTTSFALVDVTQFDTCTDTQVFRIITEITEGVEFHAADLNKASLEVTLSGIDEVSGAEVTVTLSATWIGFGERFRFPHFKFREKTPEILSIAGENGALREATTSATVTVGGESIAVEEPGTPGSLGWVNRGRLTVEY